MRKRFEGKVCVVTASSTGIGLAISELFAREGGIVIINSRSQKNVDEAVNKIRSTGGKADGVVCHAGKIEDIKLLLSFVQKKYGKIDVLIPNAAVSSHIGKTLDMNTEQFDKMFEVNIKGTFLLIKEALPLLQKSKEANIIIMASIAGYNLEGLGVYGVTKTTLIALSKVLSKELQGDNIRVNALAPVLNYIDRKGLIKTRFSQSQWQGKEEQVIKDRKINRLGEVEDIANAAGFLASSDASYVNGETIVVAGKPAARL